ncbi:GIY-YIG nuclease family protein [Elizabethkingia anophelis]|uniref:GIY-YIG nuclease family protein n=1 Tax=Elizabethkingia anophelis TaxID=1117645 RepID=UPI0021A59FCC|nr:GIY-YIG nuclease family protein [Elizabethkingia anophelis]MCT4193873.1 GIY-YIG nuclease family protein [Elizabethkingia anophelis]
MSKKISIEDIINSELFGKLESKEKKNIIKTEDDRLIDSFEEINLFFSKNNREPNTSNMSEYGLYSKLKNFRENIEKKNILKPFDKYNLLGEVTQKSISLHEILNNDKFGLISKDEELEIFKFKHTPKPEERAETDFVARRKPIKEKDFKIYEEKFHNVHQEIKSGKRKIIELKDVEKHLLEGRYYIIDGLILLLEKVDFKRENDTLGRNTLRRKDGRTRIIFENGTESNMLYRSLAKAIYNGGKMITETDEDSENELYNNSNLVDKEDVETGWIYILKTLSTNPKIQEISDLYKIGFSNVDVNERIKNASNEATYLFSDVKIVANYKCYNLNTQTFENIIHRFFGKVCLNVDITNSQGLRISPREWFVVPFEIIDEAIDLIINGTIANYIYNEIEKKIKLKSPL